MENQLAKIIDKGLAKENSKILLKSSLIAPVIKHSRKIKKLDNKK